MHFLSSSSAVVLTLVARQVSGLAFPVTLPVENPVKARAALPFNQIVAFGDDLSDNGNGSYAHGITGGTKNGQYREPAPNVYGFGTWTNGPVAISYLADLYNLPLSDYAWGGSAGGAFGGATIDNAWTPGMALYEGRSVPSVHEQIRNNYSQNWDNIKNALHFIWVGHEDLKQTDVWWDKDPKNAWFAPNISSRIVAEAEYLVENGAQHVVVANIYPKHLAPVTRKYLCPNGWCVEPWGEMIHAANLAIEQALKASKYSDHFIYYDVFTYMIWVMNLKDYYGFTTPLGWICDGGGEANWTTCASDNRAGADTYFWMNWGQPTTRMHKMIAQNLKYTIDTALNLC